MNAVAQPAAISPAVTDPDLPPGLARLGIAEWGAVPCILPAGYADYTVCRTLGPTAADGLDGEAQLFSLRVSDRPTVVGGATPRIGFAATDGTATVRVTIFHFKGPEGEAWRALVPGQRIHVLGTLQRWGEQLQLTNPLRVDDDVTGRVVPLYRGRRGVVGATAVAGAVRWAMAHHLQACVDRMLRAIGGPTEREILAAVSLPYGSLAHLLRAVHSPESLTAAETALRHARRLAAFAVVRAAQRQRRAVAVPASRVPITPEAVRRFIARLPVGLTDDQRCAVREICADIAGPYPMRRILSGDVGTGKTFTFMVPAMAVREAGGLVVIVTPSSLLVEQFVSEVRGAMGDDVPVVAVTGKSRGLPDLAGNPVLVGTTAVLARLAKAGHTPALLVIDEQQKFSVAQKAAIVSTGTNLLESTATPIPRSTALITHGAVDVSLLRQCPVVKAIETRIVEAADARRLFAHTRRVIDAGGQVAIIYPRVDDPKEERRSVKAAFDRWVEEFPGRVGMVHGAMKEPEKIAAVDRLKRGEHAICIGSTVMELGLTLPALKSVVVVNAERYGVSQLHQLRGRVARHGGRGYFFLLLPDAVAPATRERLELLVAHVDGFTLAEADARLRGYGDLAGNGCRQHGTSGSELFVGAELSPAEIHEFCQ